MHPKILITLLLAGLSTSLTAGSNYWGWLTDSIIAEFDKADSASFKAFVKENIESLADKEKASWKSEANEFRGIMKPEVTYELQGNTCRQVRFALQGKHDRKSFHKFDICKRDGRWQIVRSPLTGLNKKHKDELKNELHQVLDEGEDGFPVSWSLRKANVTGTFVPLNQYESNCSVCRDVAISVANTNGQTASGRYKLCKTSDQWERNLK